MDEKQLSVEDDANHLKEGFQIGLTGADEDCSFITFAGRKGNWKLSATSKVADEIACAERFCRAEQPKLTKFRKMPTDSPVDIHAESEDKTRSRDFQVTFVWSEAFWEQYGVKRETDNKITREQLKELIRQSIKSKIAKRSSSQKVDLLIDCKPADLPAQCVDRLKADSAFREEIAKVGNFREIWIVGHDKAARLK